MYQNCCKKCGSISLHTEEKGNNTGLYCDDCGAWIKWLSKDELRAFNHAKETEVKRENNIVVNDTKSKELYEASLPLFEFMNKYYCPMDKAILTEGRVEIVCGDIGVPLPVRD